MASLDLGAYVLRLPLRLKAELWALRLEPGLLWAETESEGYLAGISPKLWAGQALRSLPLAHYYELREGLLYALGQRLPQAQLPPNLNWQSLAQSLRPELPAGNFHFFRLPELIQAELKTEVSGQQEAAALLCTLSELRAYLPQAPAWRLANLRWTQLGEQALILGSPLLPLPGLALHKSARLYLPLGLCLKPQTLIPAFCERLDPSGEQFLFWLEGWQLIPQTAFERLFRGA